MVGSVATMLSDDDRLRGSANDLAFKAFVVIAFFWMFLVLTKEVTDDCQLYISSCVREKRECVSCISFLLFHSFVHSFIVMNVDQKERGDRDIFLILVHDRILPKATRDSSSSGYLSKYPSRNEIKHHRFHPTTASLYLNLRRGPNGKKDGSS